MNSLRVLSHRHGKINMKILSTSIMISWKVTLYSPILTQLNSQKRLLRQALLVFVHSSHRKFQCQALSHSFYTSWAPISTEQIFPLKERSSFIVWSCPYNEYYSPSPQITNLLNIHLTQYLSYLHASNGDMIHYKGKTSLTDYTSLYCLLQVPTLELPLW